MESILNPKSSTIGINKVKKAASLMIDTYFKCFFCFLLKYEAILYFPFNVPFKIIAAMNLSEDVQKKFGHQLN